MALPPGSESDGGAPKSRLGLSLILSVCLGACAPEPAVPSDPELRAELGIPDEVRIHRIDLSGRADETRVLPRSTEIRSGDVVQFVVLDHRVHLIRFHDERLTPAMRDFLVETSQDRPPPLVEQGTRLVLSFDGAPVGTYGFRVEGNGPPIEAEIRVLEAQREARGVPFRNLWRR